MLYLYACMAIAFVGMYYSVLALGYLHQPGRRVGELLGAATLILPTVLIATPLIWEVLSNIRAQTSKVAYNAWPMFAWFTGLGAVVGLVTYGWQLLRLRMHSAPSHLAIGAAVLGFAVSVYMLIVDIDQLVFFAQEGETGMVNWNEFRNDGVNDLTCDHGVLVVRYSIERGDLTYRCPTIVAFDIMTSRPFVPWPGYTEGESRELAAALKRLYDRAQSAGR
jgi:hypothetical protein